MAREAEQHCRELMWASSPSLAHLPGCCGQTPVVWHLAVCKLQVQCCRGYQRLRGVGSGSNGVKQATEAGELGTCEDAGWAERAERNARGQQRSAEVSFFIPQKMEVLPSCR